MARGRRRGGALVQPPQRGEKAVRELGYRPLVTYEEALAETERYLTESGLIKR